MNNPYIDYVQELLAARKQAEEHALNGCDSPGKKPVTAGKGTVLLFSPHPDDECITGGLPLRLRHEAGMRVVNTAVTLGSNLERRPGRLHELTDACNYLGFEIENPVPEGLESINPKGREGNPEQWQKAVEKIVEVIERYQPICIFMPHETDWNSTHIGTHFLVMDALRASAIKKMIIIETEFWGAMSTPNLMVESASEDVAELIAALSLHIGEVERNPYHLTLPFWMVDNVRRGGEVVGGQGGEVPPIEFATLYRISRWENGTLRPVAPESCFVQKNQDVCSIFSF